VFLVKFQKKIFNIEYSAWCNGREVTIKPKHPWIESRYCKFLGKLFFWCKKVKEGVSCCAKMTLDALGRVPPPPFLVFWRHSGGFGDIFAIPDSAYGALISLFSPPEALTDAF
jgi:hypothetical protein